MSGQFVRFPNEGGDEGAWADFEEAQNYTGAIGVNSCRLYNDAGVLKLTTGRIGIDNGTTKGSIVISAVDTIDISGISTGNWAKIEMAVSGTNYTLTAADISGATDHTVIPSTFTDAFSPAKNGFYITATKRCIGVIYKNSADDLSLIYNDFMLNQESPYVRYPLFAIFNSDTAIAAITNWATLTIDNTVVNEIGDVSLSSNQITLPAGRYKITAYCIADTTGVTGERFFIVYDATNSTTLIGGSAITNNEAGARESMTFYLCEMIVIEEEIDIELRLWGKGDNSGDGSPTAGDYRRIIIEKLA